MQTIVLINNTRNIWSTKILMPFLCSSANLLQDAFITFQEKFWSILDETQNVTIGSDSSSPLKTFIAVCNIKIQYFYSFTHPSHPETELYDRTKNKWTPKVIVGLKRKTNIKQVGTYLNDFNSRDLNNILYIPSSSWPSLASKYYVLPHFVLCLKVLCLLVLHWIVLSYFLFYWFGLLPLRPHIVWDFPVWSFSILSSLVFVLYRMVL